MDFSTADFSEVLPVEREIKIKHPGTDEETGVTVTIMSSDDERMKKVIRSIQDRRIKLEQRGKSFTAEEIEENGYSLCVAAMTGWNWGEHKFNGETPEFTPATIRRVFVKLPWFHRQINEEYTNTKAFFAN